MKVDLLTLREAIESSWGVDTAYHAAHEEGNPSLGQCYVTSRVVQEYLPEYELVEGEVWTGKQIEKHFWNVLHTETNDHYIDLTWQQFPAGSIVKSHSIRDRNTYGDSEATIKRVDTLLSRVKDYLESSS